MAVAGHSLGSVIGYDAINWLRSEARLGSPLQRPAVTALADLRELAGRLPPSDASAAEALLVEIEGGLGETEDPASRPVTSAEFARLTTFITFGSPLNKVLYFFRTKVKVYETVRGHIVQELHGFRLPPSLLIRDPSLQDDTVPVADGLCWVNVYSPMDPVSAKLMPPHRGVHDHRRWFKTWGRCHISYWHDPKFYREVLAALQGRCAWGHARSRGRSATPVGGSGPRPADPAT